jgi:hypothetical protein
MGCKPSCIPKAPEAVAPGTNEVPANAHPAPVHVQETAAAPGSAVALAATVSESARNALETSSALIEGRMMKAKQYKVIHNARGLAEPLLMLLIYAIQQV